MTNKENETLRSLRGYILLWHADVAAGLKPTLGSLEAALAEVEAALKEVEKTAMKQKVEVA